MIHTEKTQISWKWGIIEQINLLKSQPQSLTIRIQQIIQDYKTGLGLMPNWKIQKYDSWVEEGGRNLPEKEIAGVHRRNKRREAISDTIIRFNGREVREELAGRK